MRSRLLASRLSYTLFSRVTPLPVRVTKTWVTGVQSLRLPALHIRLSKPCRPPRQAQVMSTDRSHQVLKPKQHLPPFIGPAHPLQGEAASDHPVGRTLWKFKTR